MVTGIARLLLKQGLRYGDDLKTATSQVYNKNTYVKNYLDIMTGQQGWKKGALGYYGTEQALDLAGSMLPQRGQEDTGPTDIVIPA